MMKNAMPLSVKRAIELIGLFVLGTIIVTGNTILMPLLMSFFFSLMVLPVFRFFKAQKFPESIAALLPILLLTSVLGLIIWLFSSQIGKLISDFPQIQQTVTKHLDTLSLWVSNKFGYSPAEQLKFVNTQSKKLFSSLGGLLSGAAGSLSGILIFIGLLPIYIYLILLYRNLFLRFVQMWFKKDEYNKVEETVRETEKTVKSYLVGLLIQISYIIVLLGGTLWIFGIQNALLIGIIFAFLNLIPYLGALIGNILGVLLTLASSESIGDVLIVLAAITFVQLLDNYILMPRIVGAKIKVNPLASIVGIIIAGSMAGISGMFLAMPVLSILKIIFDHTEHYKQWGVLLGDDRPQKSILKG